MSIKKKILRFLYNKTIQQIKSYAEGTIPNDEFFLTIQKKKSFNRLYMKVQDNRHMIWPLIKEPFNKANRIEVIGLQIRLCSILDYFGITYEKQLPDLLFWEKWYNYIPSFLDPSLELMEELEDIDPEKKQTKKWHLERFKKEYPYKKYPPRWLQNCEWPLDGDKRCVFLYQTGFPNSKDFIEYHFQKSSGETIVVEQYN